MSASGTSTRHRLLLAAVLLVAASVRVWGITFGLPHAYHSDEAMIVRRALAFGSGDLNPHSFHWPALHVYLLFLLYGFLYVAGSAIGTFASVADFRSLYFSDPTLFYLAGRILSAAYGTATVYVVYRIGDRLDGPRTGLIASLCLALTYYHVWDSHIATLDVPATFWAAASFAAALHILRADDPPLGTYAIAGMLAGMAAATKYQAGIVFLAIGVAHALRNRRSPAGRLAISAISAAVTFFLTNPFLLLDWSAFLRDFRFQQVHLAEGSYGFSIEPAWRHYIAKVLWVQVKDTTVVFPDPMWILYAAGAIAVVFQRPIREAVFLLAVPVVYLLYIGRWGMAATRYLDPILPVLALLAGAWIARLGRLGTVAAAAALSISLRNVVLADWIRSHTDTRNQAKAWVEEHVPPGTRLAVESYGPPLAPSPASLERRARELEAGVLEHPTQTVDNMKRYYQWMAEASPPLAYDVVPLNDTLLDNDAEAHNRAPETNYDFDRLRHLGIHYVIISSFRYGDFRSDRARTLYPRRARFYDELDSRHPLVKEISPGPWQPGPTIRVYALEEKPS